MIEIPTSFEVLESGAIANQRLTDEMNASALGGVGGPDFLGLCDNELCKMAAWAEDNLGIVINVTGRFVRAGAYLDVSAHPISNGVIDWNTTVLSKTLFASEQGGGALIGAALSIMTELSRRLMLEVQG